jgi:hypothetical protein
MFDEFFKVVDLSRPGLLIRVGQYFSAAGLLTIIEGSSTSDFQAKKWPNEPGVYVIHDKSDSQTLYIGMCGKLKVQDEGLPVVNSSRLSHRANRWTPYCFQRHGLFKDHWECCPTFKDESKPPAVHGDNYQYHFSLSTVSVHCYVMPSGHNNLSPSLLEALLLQEHMRVFGRLPLANREF